MNHRARISTRRDEDYYMPRTRQVGTVSTLGSGLGERANSLNLVRLVLASSVIVGHAWPLTGSTVTPSLEFIGGIAVNGFFAASGFLIAGSRLHTRFPAYLWRRILRIVPALVGCVAVIVLLLAPLAARAQSLDYRVADARGFAVSTIFMLNRQWGIGDTLANSPYPDVWNGSAWTLQFEFLAYLLIGVVLSLPAVRKQPRVVLSIVAAVAIPSYFLATHVLDVSTNMYLNGVRLGAFFVVGSAMYAWRERIPVRLSYTIVAAVIFVALAAFGWDWYFGQIPLAYVVLAIGSRPMQGFTVDNDLSYGVYIYAFPVAQLLVVFGAASWGLIPNMLLTFVLAIGFAWLSWMLIERPAMRAKRFVPSQWPSRR